LCASEIVNPPLPLWVRWVIGVCCLGVGVPYVFYTRRVLDFSFRMTRLRELPGSVVCMRIAGVFASALGIALAGPGRYSADASLEGRVSR
jgi:hypothetical protein